VNLPLQHTNPEVVFDQLKNTRAAILHMQDVKTAIFTCHTNHPGGGTIEFKYGLTQEILLTRFESPISARRHPQCAAGQATAQPTFFVFGFVWPYSALFINYFYSAAD